MNKVFFGECRESMRQMAKDGIKVQCCITSPPYYGLRDYGTGTWLGGNENCSHKRDSKYSYKKNFYLHWYRRVKVTKAAA